MKVASERVSCGEGTLRCSQWKNTVTVDRHNTTFTDFHRPIGNFSRHICWIIVDNQGDCPFGERAQKTRCLSLFCLDVWYVREGSRFEQLSVVYHSLENECVNSIVGPTMTQCESCLLYTSPSPRDGLLSRMPSSA